MACTAVSIDACPVMMAISQRGSSSLALGRNSRPVILGIIRSARTMSGESASRHFSAASAFPASWQAKPREEPILVHSLRMFSWSSTIRNLTWRSSLILMLTGSAGLSKYFFHGHHQLHHAKGLLDVGDAGAKQCVHGVLVDGVAGDEQHSVFELRTVGQDPRMHVGPAGAAGRAHVGDDSAKSAALELADALGSRLRRGASIAVALQRGA